MVDVAVNIFDDNGDAIDGSDLIEDAIQSFFDNCDNIGIDYDEAIEKLHWIIVEFVDRLGGEYIESRNV